MFVGSARFFRTLALNCVTARRMVQREGYRAIIPVPAFKVVGSQASGSVRKRYYAAKCTAIKRYDDTVSIGSIQHSLLIVELLDYTTNSAVRADS